jgi:hypothetical protein
MSWTLEDFKRTSLEVGQWCWGTLEGAFNEKQTISQVIVDAVIGMVPLLGDVTATRDLLAVSIGMSTDARKRQEVMQWVLLVILLFALIPVVGGVIKGVGRLALRVAGDVAKDTELLAEIVQFLNRMGHGNAPQWLKALDVARYQAQLLDKCRDFCSTVRLAIRKSLDARVGKLLPDVWRTRLEQVRDGFAVLQDLADKMIPQALKELDARLKALQNLVYRGEIHEIATGGVPRIKREAEAYLEERRLARQIRQGRFPSSECQADKGAIEARLRSKYQPNIDQGWPDILKTQTRTSPSFPGTPVFQTVASFHGEIQAVDASHLAGKTLFRVFGVKRAPAPETYAGGMFWGFGKVPESAEEWRSLSAVLDEWNGNGFIAILHFPSDLAHQMPEAKGWVGQIAEQFGNEVPAQYLEGGGQQLFINLGELSKDISTMGNNLKAGDAIAPIEKNGVKVEFHATNWTNVSGVVGYSKFSDDIKGAVRTRRLASDEIRTKVTNSKVTAAARTDTSNNQSAD